MIKSSLIWYDLKFNRIVIEPNLQKLPMNSQHTSIIRGQLLSFRLRENDFEIYIKILSLLF